MKHHQSHAAHDVHRRNRSKLRNENNSVRPVQCFFWDSFVFMTHDDQRVFWKLKNSTIFFVVVGVIVLFSWNGFPFRLHHFAAVDSDASGHKIFNCDNRSRRLFFVRHRRSFIQICNAVKNSFGDFSVLHWKWLNVFEWRFSNEEWRMSSEVKTRSDCVRRVEPGSTPLKRNSNVGKTKRSWPSQLIWPFSEIWNHNFLQLKWTRFFNTTRKK